MMLDTGSSSQKVGVELINRIKLGESLVLKVQQFEGAEIINKIQIKRKLILSIASPATTPPMRANAYKQVITSFEGDQYRPAEGSY